MRKSLRAEEHQTVYSCAVEGCDRLALQACARCERHFCNKHALPVERDLPTRGLRIPEPYWYCARCMPYYR